MNLKVTNREYFGIQRKMVSAMTTDSWQHIPHVSYIYEPDITAFFDEYKKINENLDQDSKITFNTVMLKVITEGLKAAPQMNAHIKYNHRLIRGEITTFENINISLTMILPNDEMMTVNLHDFHNKSLTQMADYIRDVRRRAEQSDLNEAMFTVSYNRTLKTIKEGKLVQAALRILGAKTGKNKVVTLKGKAKKAYHSIPETERLADKDLQQGTVTVSNIGSLDLGQRGAVGIFEIIPPQVSAICMAAVQERAVVRTKQNGEKEIAVGKVLPMCIAFDHRALDFAEVGPFTKRLDEIFANPEIIHSWL